jgi:hypothetical protein
MGNTLLVQGTDDETAGATTIIHSNNFTHNVVIEWGSAISVNIYKIHMSYCQCCSKHLDNPILFGDVKGVHETEFICHAAVNNTGDQGDDFYGGIFAIFYPFILRNSLVVNNSHKLFSEDAEGVSLKLIDCIIDRDGVSSMERCNAWSGLNPMDEMVCPPTSTPVPTHTPSISVTIRAIASPLPTGCSELERFTDSSIVLKDLVFDRCNAEESHDGGSAEVSHESAILEMFRCAFYRCRSQGQGGDLDVYVRSVFVRSASGTSCSAGSSGGFALFKIDPTAFGTINANSTTIVDTECNQGGTRIGSPDYVQGNGEIVRHRQSGLSDFCCPAEVI